MNQTTYAREFDDADLAALADSGEHYLDESGFFFMPTQSEMQEVAEIGDTLLFLDLFRSFWHQLRVCAQRTAKCSPRHEGSKRWTQSRPQRGTDL